MQGLSVHVVESKAASPSYSYRTVVAGAAGLAKWFVECSEVLKARRGVKTASYLCTIDPAAIEATKSRQRRRSASCSRVWVRHQSVKQVDRRSSGAKEETVGQSQHQVGLLRMHAWSAVDQCRGPSMSEPIVPLCAASLIFGSMPTQEFAEGAALRGRGVRGESVCCVWGFTLGPALPAGGSGAACTVWQSRCALRAQSFASAEIQTAWVFHARLAVHGDLQAILTVLHSVWRTPRQAAMPLLSICTRNGGFCKHPSHSVSAS